MGKKTGLFLPDERCLGGAMELNAIYSHMQHSARAKEPSQASRAERTPTAQQLSMHRARKLAESDPTAYNHMLNLHHMTRRLRIIQQTGSLSPHGRTEQQQQQHSSPRPLTADASGQLRRKSGRQAVTDLCPWLPKTLQMAEYRRPSTAPGALTSSSSRHSSSSGQQEKPQLTDWQQFKQRYQPSPQPPVQPVRLPQSRYYAPGPSLVPSVQYKLYKASIMQDILQRELYRAADIRALCQHCIAVNPVEHRELLREVVADVLQELDVAY